MGRMICDRGVAAYLFVLLRDAAASALEEKEAKRRKVAPRKVENDDSDAPLWTDDNRMVGSLSFNPRSSPLRIPASFR